MYSRSVHIVWAPSVSFATTMLLKQKPWIYDHIMNELKLKYIAGEWEYHETFPKKFRGVLVFNKFFWKFALIALCFLRHYNYYVLLLDCTLTNVLSEVTHFQFLRFH